MKTVATPATPHPLRRFWYRWRFHLNILLILIPLGFMPRYFQDVALFRGESGLGQREAGTVDVGPWQLTLAEMRTLPPAEAGEAGFFKQFNAALCEGCSEEVKATYLRIGKPRSLRAAGSGPDRDPEEPPPATAVGRWYGSTSSGPGPQYPGGPGSLQAVVGPQP